jgi:hypothetical protein
MSSIQRCRRKDTPEIATLPRTQDCEPKMACVNNQIRFECFVLGQRAGTSERRLFLLFSQWFTEWDEWVENRVERCDSGHISLAKRRAKLVA